MMSEIKLVYVESRFFDELHFKVKDDTQLIKLYKKFSAYNNFDSHHIVFLYKGIELDPALTIGEYNIKDQDVLKAVYNTYSFKKPNHLYTSCQ